MRIGERSAYVSCSVPDVFYSSNKEKTLVRRFDWTLLTLVLI